MKFRWQITFVIIVFITTIFFSCGRWFQPAVPKLTVVIVVDQMRYDYLARLAGLFSGGFAKLLREGAVFTQTHHDHAGTETAPGHATLLTGSHPSHHGIISNHWFDRDRNASYYCVDDENSALVADGTPTAANAPASRGKSPRTLLRHTLGDWLKAKYPQTKVISISGKDRSAILMAGWEADAAYWYHSSFGGFVSSRFYLDALPEWAKRWNAEGRPDHYFRMAWEKLKSEEAYFVSREDLFNAEADGEYTTFPHAFTAEESAADSTAKIDARFYDWLANMPFIDTLTLEFAQHAVAGEALGADATPDLLLVSLKATDAVGHVFGPLSQESEDNMLRLDADLAKFFAFLDMKVGLKNCLIALSADHGVLPLPEELRRRGFESARILEAEAIEEVKGIEKEMQQEWHTDRPILQNYLGGIHLDYRVADSLHLPPAEFRSRLAAKLRSLTFVSDIFTSDELSTSEGAKRENLDRQRNSFRRDRGPDLVMQLKPYYLVTGSPQGTTHGSPFPYDSHVPMIFWGERLKPGRVDTPARTVDLAPTLAYLLNLDLSTDLQRRVADGRTGTAQVKSKIDGEVLMMAVKN